VADGVGGVGQLEREREVGVDSGNLSTMNTGSGDEKVTAAAVQATPAYLDRDASIDIACRLIEEAGVNGAQLIVFGEVFVPGYPDWIWRTQPWNDAAFFGRLQEQAVVVPSDATERLGDAARRAGAYVAIGIEERDQHGSTLYNTLLYLAPDGTVLGKHRKLMPTGGERLIWGMGDGSGLAVHDTAIGRLGGLICWENYMPLARAAVYAQGIDIYVAPTWDNSPTWVPSLQHIAKEGRIHVIGVTPFQRAGDVSSAVPGLEDLYGNDDEWVSRGNTTIVGPEGDILAGPLVGEAGTIYAELDLGAARVSRRLFDVAGHYARPDVFRLTVDTRAKEPVTFEVEDAPED
jgi:nitrilase